MDSAGRLDAFGIITKGVLSREGLREEELGDMEEDSGGAEGVGLLFSGEGGSEEGEDGP